MFEKIKQKSKEVKDWIVENKRELVCYSMGAGAALVGVLVADSIESRNIRRRIENDPVGRVLMKQRESTGRYTMHDMPGTTIGNLSSRIIETSGSPSEDTSVIGAVVYTK